MASPQSEADEAALRTSIATIDDLIDDDGLQIMVLSMQSELNQNQRESAKRPSDLVDFLTLHYDDPDIVYARFIYALQILGHRRYGHRSIRKLEAIYKNDRPFDIDFHGIVEKKNFLLHQYLAIACRLIPPGDCCKSFNEYCANKILEHNHGRYKTPCEVLTRILYENKITPENHLEVMEEAMINADVPEHTLQQYQEICGQIESKSFQTISRSSTRTSDGLHRIRGQRNPLSNLQVRSAPGQQREVEEEELSDSLCNKRRYCTLACTGACLFLGLILCISLALIVSHSSELKKKNQPLSLFCRENVSMILTEVSHSQTASLTVTEDTKHVGDFQRAVHVYRLASPCSGITSHRENYTIINGTDLSLINGTTFYALAGSWIHFKICATTNTTAPDIERLELVLQMDSFQIIDFFHVGTDGVWQCMVSNLLLEEPGYYTINFLPPTHEASFLFNATYNVREIDAEQLQARASDSITLHMDEDSHDFALKFGAIHSCFAALISDNPNTPKANVHIQLTFKPQSSGYIIGGMLIPTLSLIIIIIVVVYACARRHKTV